MHLSDRITFGTLIDLIELRGSDAVISQSQIAEAAELSLCGVQRSLKRLMDEGRIEGTFTVGVGYRYSVKEQMK